MARIVFAQLPPPRFSFQDPPTNIPLAAGFLAEALAASRMETIETHILEPESADVLADLGLSARIAEMRPDVLALTLYVWNVQRSLFLAANVKKHQPEIRILVGGPEVAPDNAWVMTHPAVDAGVFGEGESRIVSMVAALLAHEDGACVPGTFRKDRGGLRINTDQVTAWDLSSCPYPYLNGMIRPSRDGTLFLETVRGCPFKCRYCYYHKAFQGIRRHPWNSVQEVLDFAFKGNSGVREIYLMDPTFNAARGFKRLLKSIIRRRHLRDIALHTELRADLLLPEDVVLLKEAGLASAEVGLQTVNPTALQLAGRKSNIEKISGGVALLKNAGIEVITGIILGLPGDTPEWFAKTLEWLKNTDAYSVVHPFVLSVLPGSDFRAKARQAGINFDIRPPYYVRSTSTFPEESIRTALSECERVFDMELDAIPPPSLVDRGPGLIDGVETSRYVSKWILNPGGNGWRAIQNKVWARATAPFTLWFRGGDAAPSEAAMLHVIEGFVLANPHAVLHLVWEFPVPPTTDFLRSALSASAQPGIFLNRSYHPMLSEDEVATPRLSVIVPHPSGSTAIRRMHKKYASVAGLIWDWNCREGLATPPQETPVLISASCQEPERLLGRLQTVYRDDPEEILFRDPALQAAWRRLTHRSCPRAELPERILCTFE